MQADGTAVPFNHWKKALSNQHLETGTTGAAGRAAVPSGNVEAILNRKFASFVRWVRDHISAFQSSLLSFEQQQGVNR
jgi:hypothetical protein